MMEAHKQAKSEADKQREERSESTRDRAERGSEGHPDQKAETKPEGKREEGKPAPAEEKAGKRARKAKNNVRKLRMDRMMSKAELARRAEVSTLTVDRVERGMPCRMDTKRKILEALGLKPSDRVMVFGDSPDELDEDKD